MAIDKLIDNFGYNEPISIEDIRQCFSRYSKPRVAQLVDEMVKNNQLIRFEIGMYFIPTKTLFGLSQLNPQKVIEKKYIKDKKDVYGFYSGLSYMNAIGLTTQVPNKIEIITNNEVTRGREVSVGNQIARLKKSRVKINKENFKEIQFLECITTLSQQEISENLDLLADYIKNNLKNLTNMLVYLKYFPSKTSKNFLQLGGVYGVI